jgi:hypothetical protein
MRSRPWLLLMTLFGAAPAFLLAGLSRSADRAGFSRGEQSDGARPESPPARVLCFFEGYVYTP